MRAAIVIASVLLLAGCGGSDPAPPREVDVHRAERPEMSVEECEAVGTVVGDIGDGRVHRPDYRCPDGQEPIGTVPSGVEGSVCCPKPADS